VQKEQPVIVQYTAICAAAVNSRCYGRHSTDSDESVDVVSKLRSISISSMPELFVSS
jgi:hypothetical protein